MNVTNQNIPLVHKKEFQMMTPAPANSAAGAFVLSDKNGLGNLALYLLNATTHYLYHHDQDAWIQIPSGALVGTFGAGSCGTRTRFSNTINANGGSTTSITTATAITGYLLNKKIRFLTGANAGKETTITGIKIVPGGTSTLQFSAQSSACANGDTFVVEVGRFVVLNAGTVAANIFKTYNPITGQWVALATTGLPATIGTDAKLVATPSNDIFATGTATAGASTTLTNSSKNWTVNQFANYQIRITAGTGIGQIRTIASNTVTAITVSSAWTVTPDATSVYEITGNDDFLYLLGNNAVTMYRYSFSANAWTTLAPGVARAGAPVAGMSANWIGQTGDSNFADETNIQDGRYIYSFRGGATGTLDRYDIALNTWSNIAYNGLMETFTTGSSYDPDTKYIYCKKDATNRYFRFNIVANFMEAWATNLYPDGAAVVGDKMWTKNYVENGVIKLKWIYTLLNTSNIIHRILIID